MYYVDGLTDVAAMLDRMLARLTQIGIDVA